MDAFHVCLVLAGAVLLATVVFGYERVVNDAAKAWTASLLRMQESMKASISMRVEQEALEHSVVQDQEQLADVRARVAEAERLKYREIMRQADRKHDLTALVELRWYAYGAVLLALGLTLVGWTRWMAAHRART